MNASTNSREKLDSGLIDLIAIDRDAKAAAAAAEKARLEAPLSETPPPLMLDIGADAGDDMQAFAMRMQKPWQRISRAKIAMAAGGVVLFLVGIAIATSGSSEPAKKASTASLSQTSTPLPSSIPPPPPVETLTQAAPPTPAVAPTPTPKEPSTTTASSKHDGRKVRATPRKAPRVKGPKLMKVQSSGV